MTSTRTTAQQAGFSLIEVMVSVLVLSLAFLSLGALAARSLSSNNSAMSHSVATIAMYSIMDVLRADRNNAASGAYNNSNIVADRCPTGTSQALVQLGQWCSNQLANPALGGTASPAQASIKCDASGGCFITITWADGHSATGTQKVTTTGSL